MAPLAVLHMPTPTPRASPKRGVPTRNHTMPWGRSKSRVGTRTALPAAPPLRLLMLLLLMVVRGVQLTLVQAPATRN